MCFGGVAVEDGLKGEGSEFLGGYLLSFSNVMLA